MKARASASLFDQSPSPTLTPGGASPQPLSAGERGEPGASHSPSPSGRRWPEGRDEGLVTIGALDWPTIERDLDAYGCAITPKLISREACRELAAL